MYKSNNKILTKVTNGGQEGRDGGNGHFAKEIGVGLRHE